MLEIHACENKEKYLDIIGGSSYPVDDIRVLEAFENDSVSGSAVYVQQAERFILLDVRADNDLYLYDGIVRTVLFKAIIAGVDRIIIDDRMQTDNLVRLRFIKSDSKELTDLQEFMNNCKNCRNNKE